MSLWKRGKVYWVFFNMDGKRHQFSTGTGTRKHAEAIARKLKDEANLRRFQAPLLNPAMLFLEMTERFRARGMVRPHHEGRLKQLLPYLTDVPIGRINKSVADAYRRWR